MLRPIQRLGLVNAVPLFVACLLIELAGCSARSLQPSVVAAVQPQILPAGVRSRLRCRTSILPTLATTP